MPRVVIYTTSYCPYCFGAKALLGSKNVEFEEIDVTDDPALEPRWNVCRREERCRKFLSTGTPSVVSMKLAGSTRPEN